jgi:hypothetical protein
VKKLFLVLALVLLTLTELYLCLVFVALNEPVNKPLAVRMLANGIFVLLFISNTAMWLQAWRTLRRRERTK